MGKFTRLLIALFVLFLSFFPDRASASHLKGGDTYFVCVGNGMYELVFACYYACEATSISYDTLAQDFPWIITSSCGTLPANIYAVSATPPRDVPFYCPGVKTQCDYYNPALGTYPYSGAPPGAPVGTILIEYRSAPFAIPAGCSVTATMDVSARNAAISNLVNPSSAAINIEATVTAPADGSCNNNPQFAQYPINVFCLGQNANFSQGAIDLNGDSLAYHLINPETTGGAAIPFIGGCSPANPLGLGSGLGFVSSFSFDSSNGNINLTPTMVGAYVITVQVDDYHNGVLVGSTMRDLQFNVVLCHYDNAPPYLVTGFTPATVTGALVIDSGHISVCPGTAMTATLLTTDPDSFGYAVDSTNILQSLPGSVISITHTGGIYDTAAMHITWTPGESDSGFHYFLLGVRDTFCPTPGRNTYSLIVSVQTGVSAGPDQIYCLTGQPVTLYAKGASHYIWADSATGGPPVGLISYGPDSAYIVVAPSVTSSYIVAGSPPIACRNADTVRVVTVPIFTLTATALDSSICRNNTTQLTASASPPGVGPYTYAWSPSLVVSPTSATTATDPLTTNTLYYVTVTAATGCVLTDSVPVSVRATPTQVSIVPSDNNVCPGDTVSLNSVVYADNIVSCGLVDTCVPNNILVSIPFSNDNSSTTGGVYGTAVYCSPFMGSFNSYKAQYLFTKAELNAAGLSSGSITDISFFVKQVNSTQAYDTFAVSMGCTDLDSLTGFAYNLLEVLPPQCGPNAIVPTQGWTPLIFKHYYNWDGASNLIIQICYTISTALTSADDYVSYTTTPYLGSSFIAGDESGQMVNGCSLSSGADVYEPLYTRPNVKFGQCVPNVLTYQWSPASVGCHSCPTATAGITADGSYALTVSDGSCTGSASVQVNINPNIAVGSTPALACDGNGALLHERLTNPPLTGCIQGYTVDSIAYSPIPGTATAIAPALYFDDQGFNQTDDATAGAFGIGFTFPFYCESFDSFYVNTNGWISFVDPYPATTQPQEYTAQTLPPAAGDLNPQKIVAMMMGNFWIADSFGDGGGYISYFVSGTAPHRVLVVRFDSIVDQASLADTTIGEIHLYEGSGIIDILLTYSTFAGYNHTTGIKDSTGLGLAAPGRDNQPYTVSTPEAWRFTPQYGASVAITSTVWSPPQYLSPDTGATVIATPPAPQKYYVTDTLIINQFTHPTQCIVRDTITVDTGHFSGQSLAVSPAAVCAHDTVHFTYTSIDPITSYSWAPAQGLSDSSIADPAAIVFDTTKYFITVLSTAGCRVRDSITVITYPLPLVVLPASYAACFCGPDTPVTALVSGGTPAYSYQWSDGTIDSIASDSSLGAVTYTVTVTDAHHCSAVSSPQTITIHCPRADISVMPVSDTIFLRDTATFATALISGYTYQWASDSSLVLTPAASSTGVIGQVVGHDTVSLLVTDTGGCTYRTLQVITVVEFGGFAMPTAFTPNGDGKNDNFYIVAEGPVTVTRFNIYDRWGQLVYDDPAAPGWNGSYKGKPAPSESYVYFVTVSYPDPSTASQTMEKSIQGSFQLLR
jgi:gliding motility-associated-like protein